MTQDKLNVIIATSDSIENYVIISHFPQLQMADVQDFYLSSFYPLTLFTLSRKNCFSFGKSQDNSCESAHPNLQGKVNHMTIDFRGTSLYVASQGGISLFSRVSGELIPQRGPTGISLISNLLIYLIFCRMLD
jgi:hypothetical protein